MCSQMQTPVLLPEKLSASRCLVEIVDGASTDLAGDAGAVGRFGVVQCGQQQQAQLDLKGDAAAQLSTHKIVNSQSHPVTCLT